MKSSVSPVARKEGLVVQGVGDEVLVYDLSTNKAHCLNQTAAFVWNSCDGKMTVEEIAKDLSSRFGAEADKDLIWLAIDQLSENHLLETQVKADFAGSSRRDVIKKIGLAAVIGLPVVASLVAPTSALASTSCTCPTNQNLECTQQGPPCGATCSGGTCV